MNKTKFFLAILFAFVISMHAAFALSFDVNVTPIKDKIVVDEIAEYDVAIQNNMDSDEEFAVKRAGYPFWDMYTKPLQNPITIKVPAHSSSSIRLYVHPLYITSVDTYTLEIGVVLPRTGEERKAPVTIGIKSTEPLIGGYVPTVLASLSISPDKIDPRKDFTIRIVLNNQNPINYTNLTIKIDSALVKDEIHYPLGPKEDGTIELVKKLDDITPPQEDRLSVSVFRDKRQIAGPMANPFSIMEYSVQQDIPAEQSFLKIKKGIMVISNNPDYFGTIKIETNAIKNLVSTAYPKAESLKENGKHYLVWKVQLGNDKTMSVYVTENYRPIVVILVLSIVAVMLYFVFRSPIVVRKGVANVGMNEGGISEAKVVVGVRNRSAKLMKNIEVLDHLPHIAHVEKEISIGSMQPHAIMQHPKRGIVIKWAIESLEPGDERVLSYKMKSRLSILGEFNLPAATARCKVGNRMIISNSNRVSVGG